MTYSGDVHAVRGIRFDVAPGAVFGSALTHALAPARYGLLRLATHNRH